MANVEEYVTPDKFYGVPYDAVWPLVERLMEQEPTDEELLVLEGITNHVASNLTELDIMYKAKRVLDGKPNPAK